MLRTPQILYLDDDPMQLRSVRRALKACKYDICTFTDPSEALEELSSREIDVVLSDWRMPSMNGIEFLEKATALRGDARRVLVTGEREFAAAVQAINQIEVHRLVPKPWTVADLRRIVVEMVEAVRMHRENAQLHEVIRQQNAALSRMNEDLERQVHERTRNVLDSLVYALEHRDTETQWHSRRVAAYAVRLATEIGIQDRQLRDFEWGALLHDVGKIGIPDNVLLKPAALDKDEWKVMRTHPTIGYELLKDIDFLGAAAQIVAHHHERWDGKGYPHGLAGEDICLGARVFSVIDAYDAITSDRPYRKGRDHEAAVVEIQKVAGMQLDPAIVEAFVQVEASDWATIRDEIRSFDYHDVFQTGQLPILKLAS